MFFCLLTAFVLSPLEPSLVISMPAGTELGPSHHVLFSPDGKRLYSTGQLGLIRASDPVTGKELLAIRTGERALGSIALNPHGTRLASIHFDLLKIWDTSTARELLTFKPQPRDSVPCLAFDRTGNRVACPVAPDTVGVWELSTGRPLATFHGKLQTDNARDGIHNLAYSPDGSSLAVAYSATEFVTVWSTTTRQVRFTLQVKHPDLVWDLGVADCKVAFSPDGRLIATTGSDHDNVKIWGAANGKLIHSFKGGKTMAFTPDSRYLATLAPTWGEGTPDAKGEYHWSESGGEIRIWALATGREVFSMKVPDAESISEIAFRPGSNDLATAHGDGTVKIWDLSRVLHFSRALR
jgi:WD40 repeat protein